MAVPILVNTQRFVQFAGLVALVYVSVAPFEGDVGTLCLMRVSTGVDCPACGLTRSMAELVRGNLVVSWKHHFLGSPSLALLALAAFAPAPLLRAVAGLASRLSSRRPMIGLLSLLLAIAATSWIAKLWLTFD